MKPRRALLLLGALALGCGGGEGAPSPAPENLPPTSTALEAPHPRFEGLSGFWPTERARAILERTEPLPIRADTSTLTDREREALEHLLRVGATIQRVYEASRHPQALAVRLHLERLEGDAHDAEQLEALRTLYRLFQGPIAIDERGEHVAFAPVSPYEPGRNVYPSGVSKETLQRFAEANPHAGLLDVRTRVRRRTLENLTFDRGRRDDHPVLEVLHPQLRETLRAGPRSSAFYAIPHALTYAPEMLAAYGLLREAAELVRPDDEDLADYLEQRARDLLSNDYEAGDAAWISGRPARLNAQIGAYETYDDHLFGQKAFFGMSILVRVPEAAAELDAAIARLGEYEAQLPGGPYGPVRATIPIGIYDVVADFGQARGANTASILPNEARVIRRYGRIILIRRNLLMHPAIVASAERRFRAIVVDAHADELGERGDFDRTVWHEVGHYLGPERTLDGRDVSSALTSLHNHFEELKADLIALWLLPRLIRAGAMTPERARAAYAAGVLRTLLTSEPRRTSPYATMQLMQQRWLFDAGVLQLEGGKLRIDYERYPAAVEAMLGEVLRIQSAGDREAAEGFVERWARWDPDVQGVIGAALEPAGPRRWLPVYAALE